MNETANSNQTNEPQYISVYILKVIAALCVSWGHLVTTGSPSTELPDAGITGLTVPLLPQELHKLWKPDFFLITKHNIPLAAVGVILFFLASGFLTPHLQEKYNQKNEIPHLLQSRLARIYPFTFACSVVIGLVLFFSQGVVFSLANYLTTITVTQTWTMIEPITGLVWYLNVLVFFYLIATVIPQFSIRNLTLVYMGLYMIVGAGRVFGDLPCTNLIMSFCYVAKFCGIPLLGTAVYFLKEQRWIVVFLWFFVLTLGLLRFESYLNGTVHCYTNAKTFYFAFALVFIAWILGKYAKGSERVKRFLKKADQILLPFYLVHFSVGFNVIYWLRKFDVNVYICVFAAYLAALCCAKAVAVAVKSASRLIAYARRSRHSGGHAKV